ncbi:MAG: Iron-sulfur flavoprotein [Promethearchaeota archaeon]|nr:MAG: Iron-sulfur flavoprotein [Candidatus Lokiarchaeota archaeon]
MKTLILDGSKPKHPIQEEINSIVDELLKDTQSESTYILLADKQITYCQGCFDCWLKTPGICRIDDFGREITNLMVNNDLIILITPITFGGYSFELKKAVDRFIPNLLPFFKEVNGEIHHKQRYDNISSKIFIGFMKNSDEEKEDIFKELTQRNALNMEGDIFETLVYIQNGDISIFKTQLQNIIMEVKSRL